MVVRYWGFEASGKGMQKCWVLGVFWGVCVKGIVVLGVGMLVRCDDG